MSATKAFGLAGIIGWPVAHSRSPVVHNYWLAEHDLAGRYVLCKVMPERLPAALRGLAALGFRGCNVTTPHKQAVMPLIDHVDPMAARIGAVNTIVVQPDGSLRGFNNDGNGFVQGLRDEKPDWRPDQGPIAVVGAGGAARAIVVALVAQGAREIRLVNRTHDGAATSPPSSARRSPPCAGRNAPRRSRRRDARQRDDAGRRASRRSTFRSTRCPATPSSAT